jgi:hypothetical protein
MSPVEEKNASKNQQDYFALSAGNAVKVALNHHPSRICAIYSRDNYKLRKTGQIA